MIQITLYICISNKFLGSIHTLAFLTQKQTSLSLFALPHLFLIKKGYKYSNYIRHLFEMNIQAPHPNGKKEQYFQNLDYNIFNII